VNFGGTFYGEPQHDDDAPWNQADAPEKALAIRQAMSLAIDRAAIHERLLFGEGDLVHAPLFQYPSNPELVDPAWTLPAFDLALAKQKLVEGGYPNGFPIIFPIYDQKFGTAIVGEAIAGMWEDLGLQVTRQVTDENAFGPKLDARDTDGHVFIYVGGWYPETAIRLNLLQPVREDALFVDPVSTETFQKLNAEPDKAKRYALARELASHFITEMRAIPLFTMGIPYVVGPRVANWTPVPSWDQISGLETATP
jgi:ABC-type transport system substrate-binding protein